MTQSTKTQTAGFSLKKFKHSKFASRETECFEALVCTADGVVVAHARNDGQGGCTMVSLTEAGKANPLVVKASRITEFDDNSLISIVDDLVNEELNKKFKASLRKRILKELSTTVLFQREGDAEKGIFRTLRAKFPTAEATVQAATMFKNSKEGEGVLVILNLLPFEEAFKLRTRPA